MGTKSCLYLCKVYVIGSDEIDLISTYIIWSALYCSSYFVDRQLNRSDIILDVYAYMFVFFRNTRDEC